MQLLWIYLPSWLCNGYQKHKQRTFGMPSSRGLQQILIATRYVICAIQVISLFGNSYVQEMSVEYNVIAQLYHSYYKENERTWEPPL